MSTEAVVVETMTKLCEKIDCETEKLRTISNAMISIENKSYSYTFEKVFEGSLVMPLFLGRDFLNFSIPFECISQERSCLTREGIESNDLFIKAGHFTALVKHYLFSSDKQKSLVSEKYTETNTYSITLKLGIRLKSNQTQISVGGAQGSSRSNKRDVIYIKLVDALNYLRGEIWKNCHSAAFSTESLKGSNDYGVGLPRNVRAKGCRVSRAQDLSEKTAMILPSAVSQSQHYQIHGNMYYNDSVNPGPEPLVQILQSQCSQVPAPRSMETLYREMFMLRTAILNLEREFIIAQQSSTIANDVASNNMNLGEKSTITSLGFTVGIKRERYDDGETMSLTTDESSLNTLPATEANACPCKQDDTDQQKIDGISILVSSFDITNSRV